MSAQSNPKILIVRVDRIGDVVLSIPVFEALKSENTYLLLNKRVAPVFEGSSFSNRILTFDPTKQVGVGGIKSLAKEIAQHHFDAVLFLQMNFTVAAACKLAKIPVRFGPYSKWYSYLMLTDGLHQHRSDSSKNEAHYNFDIAARFAEDYLNQKKIQFQNPTLRVENKAEAHLKKYIVMHPGMGGSALNWPVENYKKLAASLIAAGHRLIVTGIESERKIADQIAAESKAELLLNLPMTEFLSVLQNAECVIAPSTGPLHLAAALGTKTVSFYPPIQVQHPQRWGPIGTTDWVNAKNSSSAQNLVFMPDVECPAKYRCYGERCPKFDCMTTISSDEVFEKIISVLKRR